MTSQDHGEHLSDLAFDRLAAGTLPPEARATAEAHVATCARCRQRRQLLDDDRGAFIPDAGLLEKLAAPAPAETVANVVPFRPRARMVQALVPMLAAAAVVALVVTRKPADDDADATATKGASIYEVFVKDAAGTRTAARGDIVHPGDVVQVTRTGVSTGFVGLFSVDGNGAFTRFVPDEGATLLPIEGGTRVALPRSVVLDDATGTERFVVVECDSPMAVVLAEDSAKGGPVQPGCVVVTHPLEKR